MTRFASVRPIAVGFVITAIALSGCASKKSPAKAAATSGPAAAAASTASSGGSSAPASAQAAASGGASSAAAAIGSGLKGDPEAIKLVTQAVQGLSSLKSVHITGSLTDKGQTGTLDLQVASSAGLSGTVMYQGGAVKVIVLPTAIYVNVDAKILAAASALAGGASAGAATQEFGQYAGKWIKLVDLTTLPKTGSNPLGKFDNYSDLSKLSDSLKSATGTVTLGDKKTINGQSTQGVIITDPSSGDNGGVVIYFATGGNHLPVEIVPQPATGGASADNVTGKLDFSDYNKPVSISAPPGAVDLSATIGAMFGGALGGPLASASAG
jgi:hypothetical protein